MIKIIEKIFGKEFLEKCQIIEVIILEKDTKVILENDTFGRDRSISRERQYLDSIRRNDKSKEEDKTKLKVLVADTYKNHIRTNTEETIDHFNY